jgi:predicted Fe-S protein YdhL (DUF1289 family)
MREPMSEPMSLPSDLRWLDRMCRQAGAVQHGGPVPSPCRNVCRMDAVTGYCEGCLRTIDEIADWSGYGDDDKRVVWAALARRAAARIESLRA